MHNVVINSGGGESELVEGLIAIGICFTVIVLPLLVIFVFGRRRGQQPAAASADQERASIELWDRARRMETRIEYLERVLDSEMPGWRNRS